MATNGLIAKSNFTLRQQEIVTAAAKQLNIPYDNVGSATFTNNLPELLNVSAESGNFSTSIVPLYGTLLTQTEKAQLLSNRLATNDAQLESLNGVSNLLGKNKQPVVSSAGTDRVRAETLPSTSFNPSSARLANAGLPAGAQNLTSRNAQPIVKFTAPSGEDTRVRIRVPSSVNFLTTGPVLSPLNPTNGVLFPYTPNITTSFVSTYGAENLTHSNYAYQFYQSSNTEAINITAMFACKNGTDAAYVLAAQHFFRTVTKMFYGQDAEAGLPPPVLRLEGHGDYQFGSHKEQIGGVPIVINSFSVTLPEDVDYITADSPGADAHHSSGGQTRVPIVQTFNITCTPLYSRKSISNEFGFRKFAAGQLLGSPSRGGFI